MRRLSFLGCRVAFLAIGLSGWLAAQAISSGVSFDISSGAATATLKEFATQAHLQLLFDYKAVQRLRTPAIKGQLTPSEALKEMLSGSGFTFRQINDHTIAVMALGAPTSSTGMQPMPSGAAAAEEGKTETPAGFLLAQVTQGQAPSSPSVEAQQKDSQKSEGALQEVVVTAQKRSENLLDVPIPVTAISADTLVSNNQLRIQDYFSSVPGFSVSPVGATGSYQTLAIRGISTGIIENPTVGVTVDDVPFGTSTSNGGGGTGQIVPDVDPSDLARVEVLRGPQGTLYGAASMGGLLKFVTIDPSTDGVSGHVEADASTVYNGANPGLGARGSVNLPVSETFAVRASAFGREDAGYIDDVEDGERGVNRDTADGAHLAALWQPSDLFRLKFSALYQSIRGDGASEVDQPINGYVWPVVLGDLQQYRIRQSGGYDRSLQAYSVTLTARLGNAELTSITGYNIQQYADSFDATYYWSTVTPYGAALPNFGVAGDTSPESDRTSKLIQELRLSVPLGNKLDWLIGGFYTYENSKYFQNTQAEDPASGEIVASVLTDYFLATYMETAVFTDMTVHLADRFDIQIGGRESQIRQTFSDGFGAPLAVNFFGVSPYIQPQLDSKANAFTYLVTPKWQVSPGVMIYARLASGYRPGGSNYGAGGPTGVPGQYIPAQYQPDKTENYELGLKGEFLDHTLSVDTSLYYIDWKNMQVSDLSVNGFGFYVNTSGAKSQGLELSVDSRPTTGLTIGGWIAVSDAVLTQAFPANSITYGVSGDRLPYSSRFSGNLSVQQDFPLGGRLRGFAGGTVAYIGDREGEFAPQGSDPADRARFPAYTKVDLRAGARYEDWTVSLAINNVTDHRGILSGGLGAYPPFGFVYIQPRTVALSVVRTF